MTVAEILSCEKRLTRKRKPQLKLINRSWRADLPVECKDSTLRMVLFLRKSDDFPEDFSVGLRLETPNPLIEYTIVLLRAQGPHGGQRVENDIHNDYHVHYYSQDDLDHRRKNPSLENKCFGKFASFEQAISFILRECNIIDENQIFADEKAQGEQISMFDEWPDVT